MGMTFDDGGLRKHLESMAQGAKELERDGVTLSGTEDEMADQLAAAYRKVGFEMSHLEALAQVREMRSQE